MTRPCTVPLCPNPRRDTDPLCAAHRSRKRNWGDVLADVPIAKAAPGAGVTGCWYCGADDVRPGPCQAWCRLQRVRAAVAA